MDVPATLSTEVTPKFIQTWEVEYVERKLADYLGILTQAILEP